LSSRPKRETTSMRRIATSRRTTPKRPITSWRASPRSLACSQPAESRVALSASETAAPSRRGRSLPIDSTIESLRHFPGRPTLPPGPSADRGMRNQSQRAADYYAIFGASMGAKIRLCGLPVLPDPGLPTRRGYGGTRRSARVRMAGPPDCPRDGSAPQGVTAKGSSPCRARGDAGGAGDRDRR